MKAAASDWHRLDAQETVGAEELCRACRLTIEELHEIVGYGVLAPLRHNDPQLFGADWLMPLREAARMRHDFDLDLFAVSLITDYLHRIDALEHELRALRSRLGA
jgi:chaperone modulatory protein CbpM